jgi:branched-chain amino acid transport system substrate-binding protein
MRGLKRVMLGLALGLAMAGTAQAADPVVIGVFGPMTGERSALGVRFREGITMYIDAVNAAGGIGGRPLEARFEDTRGQPREAANIAQKFAQDPAVLAVIGGQTSTESMAAAPILTEAKMAQVSPTASHPDYTKLSPYQFRISNTQDTISLVHADMLAKKLGFKQVAVLYFQDDWGSYVNKSTTEQLAKLGVKVVMDEAIIPNTRDFRALVTKLKATKPDGIFLAAHYAESAVFMQQLRQSDPSIKVAATDTLNDPKFIELAGGAAEGVVMPTPFLPGAAAAKEFSAAYEKRFNKVPDYYSAFSYDSMLVIGEAMKQIAASGGKLERQTLRDAIAKAPPRTGVSGNIAFQENLGDPKMRDFSLIVVKGQTYQAY